MKTPYYHFNKDKIKKNYLAMKQNLQYCDIYYALKANAENEVLETLCSCGAKFEIASIEELYKLQNLKVTSSDIICSLPVKSIDIIKNMYLFGCRYFVFDDIGELKKLLTYAPESKKILRIYIGDLIDNSIAYGLSKNEFDKLCETKNDDIKFIDGITFYISKNKNISNVLKVLDRAEYFISKLPEKELFLNIGGNYRQTEELNDDFYNILNEMLAILKSKYDLKLLAEPGHGIVKNTGLLITTVVLVKNMGNETYVYIDAGTPTGALFEPDEINKKKGIVIVNTKTKYKFFGITCSHQLLFEKELNFEIDAGDVLEFCNYGSYTICLSNNFHSWNRPQIVIE